MLHRRIQTLTPLATALGGLLALGIVACSDDDEDSPTSPTTGGMESSGGTSSGGTTSPGGAGAGGEDNGGGDGGMGSGLPSILDIATTDEDFSTLAAAVTKAGLSDALDGEGITVFAPTNDAFTDLFEAIGVESVDDLSAEQLVPILRYHVVGAKVDAAAATALASGDMNFDSLGGNVAIDVGGDGDLVLDGSATITTPDVMASNGVIHVIDAVILPSITDVVVSDQNLSSLAAAVGVAELADALDDDDTELTVFAPTNDAFAGLVTALSANESTGVASLSDFSADNLTPVLLYHVAEGAVVSGDVEAGELTTLGGTPAVAIDVDGNVTIDTANITTVDILTSNGVIHVIDAVIVPSITDVVTTDPELTSLAAAVGVSDGAGSGLIATLDGDGDFTLFAPTDDAFEAVLSDNGLDDLTALVGALGDADDLTGLLLYHTAGSRIYAIDAVAAAGTNVTSLSSGAPIAVGVDDGSVLLNDGVNPMVGFNALNDATVISTDIFTTNGVVHKIDAVIAP